MGVKTIKEVSSSTLAYAQGLQEERAKRDAHWARLYYARGDYRKSDGTDVDLMAWLERVYGLKCITNATEGLITGEYVVVDEKKYTMYLLKYGSAK